MTGKIHKPNRYIIELAEMSNILNEFLGKLLFNLKLIKRLIFIFYNINKIRKIKKKIYKMLNIFYHPTIIN